MRDGKTGVGALMWQIKNSYYAKRCVNPLPTIDLLQYFRPVIRMAGYDCLIVTAWRTSRALTRAYEWYFVNKLPGPGGFGTFIGTFFPTNKHWSKRLSLCSLLAWWWSLCEGELILTCHLQWHVQYPNNPNKWTKPCFCCVLAWFISCSQLVCVSVYVRIHNKCGEDLFRRGQLFLREKEIVPS